MRLREIDAGGWARMLGGGLLVGALWTVLAVRDLDLPTVVVVFVGVALLVAVVAAVSAAWAAAGGYRAQRRLHAWVRGADVPAEVPVPVRIRYLRRVTERGAWFGWLGLALAVMNAWSGATAVLDSDDPWSSVFSFVAAATWAWLGASTVVFARRSMPRARLLLAEAEQEQADSWFERQDSDAS